MDAREKNRYVLDVVDRRLDQEDDFYGKIVLNCKGSRIVSHKVEQTYLTDDLVEEDGEPEHD